MHGTQTNDKATTANNWKKPSAMISGRYNTPPLLEDLVPRSGMAPEDVGVQDHKTDNEENAWMHETNTYANAMHMMT